MRKLLNTLYITSEQLYLALDNSNVVVKNPDKTECERIPLHLLESIVSFSRKGVSIPLIAKCSALGIPIHLMSEKGSFLASIQMPSRGNVLLRKAQYRISDDKESSFKLAACFIEGKIRNMKHLLDRARWNRQDLSLKESLDTLSNHLENALFKLYSIHDVDTLRGVEGDAASAYFQSFQSLILRKEDAFIFHGRSRRPPLDQVNALLSFAYTILTNECAAALESVGLDSYVGFLHSDHSGRKSLACDLVEELRPAYADRYVLQMINTKTISAEHFEIMPDKAVYLNKEGKKVFLHHWQLYKQEELLHPVLLEKIPFGLIPYVQAQLLARYICGDVTEYVPFYRR